MYKRVVPCGMPGCRERAAYKVASPWSDGGFVELKSYALACREHVEPLYRDAVARRRDFRPSPAERVEPIGIYRYEYGKADRDLQRLWNLERHLAAGPAMADALG